MNLDWDSIMLKVWVGVFTLSTIAMPVNVALYLRHAINEKQLILVTLVLSYNALQLSAAAAIVAAVGARRVRDMQGGEQNDNEDSRKESNTEGDTQGQ